MIAITYHFFVNDIYMIVYHFLGPDIDMIWYQNKIDIGDLCHPVYGQSFGLLLLSKKWPAAEEEKGCTEVFYGTDK
jgi:hypothetical protein